MDKKTIKIGIILTAIFLFIGIATLPNYGLTWDFHFHFFSGANFFDGLMNEDETRQFLVNHRIGYAISNRGSLPSGTKVFSNTSVNVFAF